MRPNEIVVARLAKGARVVPYLSGDGKRVEVGVGRNKTANIPLERIALATGIVMAGQEELEIFSVECDALATSIDLSDVWKVLAEDADIFRLEDLAELYWGAAPSQAQLAALSLYLDRDHDLFVHGPGGYLPRTVNEVKGIHASRLRQSEREAAELSIMSMLEMGALPKELSEVQRELVRDLKGYAIDGETFGRRVSAKRLLSQVSTPYGDLQKGCFELLVGAGIFSSEEPIEFHRARIRRSFPEDALAEANSAQLQWRPDRQERDDLTSLPVFTIDDEGTQERDDALSLQVIEGGYRIGVHIADAAALIAEGGPIDVEADRRMATLYAPDGKVDMLPPGFAHEVASLEPGLTRLSVSLMIDVNRSGKVGGWQLWPSLVRSRISMSYAEADRALEDASSVWHQTLKTLRSVAVAFRETRENAGAFSIEGPEMAINLNESGQVEVRVLERSAPSRQLVAELMIMCNSILAGFCKEKKVPATYRKQEAPDTSGLDLELYPEGTLRRYLLMRRLPAADLDTIPGPHSGLGVAAYIQATSPLRRYPDLVMQRQIVHFLRTGEPRYTTKTLFSVAQRAGVQFQEIRRVEGERKRYWFLKYLEQEWLQDSGSDGDSRLFEAVVLEKQPGRAALLELVEFPFRVRVTLPPSITSGDTVNVRLEGVDLWKRTARFVHDRH